MIHAADASVSPDGNWLAGESKRMNLPIDRTKKGEAICWDNNAQLRIVNEQGQIFRVDLAAFTN